jgi:hypothetical protein
MTFAYDYPLLGVFWTVLLLSLWVAWAIALVFVVLDVFRSKDMRGIAKVVWLMILFFLPLLGTALYLAVRGDSMAERSNFMSRFQATDSDFHGSDFGYSTRSSYTTSAQRPM